MPETLVLRGLDGRNPLGFLSALGALVVADRMSGREVRLAWTDDVIPRPELSGTASLDELVGWVLADIEQWKHSPALNFEDADDVKFAPEELRRYLLACRSADDGGRSAGLASALVAEGSMDNNGAAKPTDLHFSAGQQRFLRMARELRAGVTAADIHEAITGPWRYESQLPTFGWDVTDDRIYALSAVNPGKAKKYSVPGADWLSLVALQQLPVMRGRSRTITPGCDGSWKRGFFSWTLWSEPLAVRPARLVATSAIGQSLARDLSATRAFRSAIRRSEQGGYGTFGPPRVIWERT